MSFAHPVLRRWAAAFAFAAGLASGSPAHADERILAYDSDITIAPDASMQVVESIRVRSEGNRIRHGIYRDFPTDYRDERGNMVRVAFDPQDLERDGKAEAWHKEAHGNGVRVYFGAEDTLVEPGEHTYVFRYRTTRQLGFFADHDELYWNVTGNGWDFPIDTASATVTLPGAVPAADIHVEGYTGEQGAKGQDYTATADAPSHAVFATTRPLGVHEGLTIVVGFPKGIVAAPTTGERWRWFASDNAAAVVLVLGLVALWWYYLVKWLRVGRDPKPGVIIPQYEAPEGFTPGGLRHLERMGWDDRCAAADLVDLGVKGAIRIRDDKGAFTIERADDSRGPIPQVEQTLRDGLLSGTGALTLEKSEHARISAALKAHEAELKLAQAGRYYHKNTSLIVIGAVATVVLLGIGAFALGSAARSAGAGFILFWLSFWTIGVVVLVSSAFAAWRGARSAGGVVGAIGMTLFALPFVAGEFAGLFVLFTAAGIVFAIATIALIVTNVLFYRLMRAPTAAGRALLDRIAGLRMYLGVAERDELAAQKEPPLTADRFQTFLPYALALDVERTWADKFAAAVGPAAAAAAAGAMGWYNGSTGGLSNLSHFTSSFGSSFSSAISSSSTAPGSSSGGGGGGSSGGGGGGGGGGGW